MLKIIVTACIDKSSEDVWKYLSDLENISLWSEPVLSAECTGEFKRGIGAERICQLSNNIIIFERWNSWDEGKSFSYEGYNLPLVKSANNTWSLTSENGKTLLKSESELVIKGGFLGRLFEPIMKYIAVKMGNNSLAAFKYLVEKNEPFQGKHSKLPRIESLC
jgi:hypothetical protein